MFTRSFQTIAIVAFAGLASIARADLPAALDLIPSDVAIAGGIEKLDRFQANMAAFRKASGGDSPNVELAKLDAFFQMPGMNKTGSAAIAVIGEIPQGGPGAKDNMNDMPFIVLAPVSDYALLVTTMGADPAAAVAEIKGPQNTWYVKNSGNGYVVASNKRELTETFEPKPGNLETHKKNLGVVGGRTASNGDFIIIANIPKLGSQIKKAAGDATKGLDQIAAMQGGDAPNMAMLSSLTDTFVRDAQVGVISTTISESGLSLDLASQFKEGSELAGLFNSKGSTTSLTGVLPNKPFLMAFALDTTSAGFKKIFQGAIDMQQPAAKEGEKAAPSMLNMFVNNMKSMEGMSGIIGYPKGGLAAGLFSETVFFMKTPDAAALQKTTGEGMSAMNGLVQDANKYITTYDVSSSEIGGTKVDSWTLDMQPADPAMGDGGMGMVKGFLTGPAGKFQGVVAPVKGGLIMTYSQYEPTVAAVLKTAAEGNGLSKGLESAAAALPPDRSFELFLGTKSIMETISGVMGMFGQAPMPVPADIAHIAMGGTSDSGGIQLRTIVPASVFKAMAEAKKNMQGPDPMDEEPVEPASKEDKKDTKPKF